MKYSEEKKDLFSVPKNFFFAHCISDDYALGAGIAKEFDRRFNMKNRLFASRNFNRDFRDTNGHCILIDRTFNLVTKAKCWQKPTYESLTKSLYDMKRMCQDKNIMRDGFGVPIKNIKIAMPLIGCGLDKLEWDRVSEIIKEVFEDTDIEILICKL